MNADGNERIEISLDDLAEDFSPTAPAAAPAVPPPTRAPLPGLPDAPRRTVGVGPATGERPAPRFTPPPAREPLVALSTALEVLAGIVGVGLIIKVSIIGYYPDELPALAVAAGIALVVGWVGRLLDH